MRDHGHWTDPKGRLVPEHLVSDADKLKDDVARKVLGFAEDLSAQIARFRAHTFDDVYALLDLLKEKYGAAPGGPKGNVEIVSFDGCVKVQVAVADHIAFGPELQAAKALIDECIAEWSPGSRDEIRALVNYAFETRKSGQIAREALFGLRRLDIKDEKWRRAMDAITDSIRIVGSKAYVRVYRRRTAEEGWQMVPLNIAAV